MNDNHSDRSQPKAAPGVWPPAPTTDTMFLETLPLDALENFPTQHVLLTILLSVVTLGIYPAFWLYGQAIRLNGFLPKQKVALGFVAAVVALTLGSAALDIATLFMHSVVLDKASTLLDRIVLIALLVLTFQVRNGLNRLLESRSNDSYWFSTVWTLLFGVPYLQYKINKNLQQWHRERAQIFT